MDAFDFWYAVNHTRVVVRPRQPLETFGHTTLRYHLLTEMPDSVDRIRIREGRVLAYRPTLLTPGMLAESPLEGFEDPAVSSYLDWLRAHERDLAILQYGFRIRKEPSQEHRVADKLAAVVARVKRDVLRKADPMAALLVGVEEPWEVCLLKLLVEVAQGSAAHNARELLADPEGHRHEIESAFESARGDASRLSALAALLTRRGLFPEYEDRFFELVRSARGRPGS